MLDLATKAKKSAIKRIRTLFNSRLFANIIMCVAVRKRCNCIIAMDKLYF